MPTWSFDGGIEIAKALLLLNNRQVEVLSKRENEDVFLTGIEPLREWRARLRNLNIDLQNLKLVTIDRRALEPQRPVKPKKALIIILGLIIGAMLGVQLALIRHFVSIRRLSVVHHQVLAPVLNGTLQGSNGQGLQNVKD
jgi:LPS O-antigen subunit length determinant protein (WzzB/FepE family)